MKNITEKEIENAVYQAATKMCFSIDNKVEKAIKVAYDNELGKNSKNALKDILDNICIAKEKHIPVCQDTGIVIAFCEIGQDVHIIGNFTNAINNGISRAYKDEFLRKSVVNCPIERINTCDNTPAIIHYKLVLGDFIKITLCPKGAGSENMGRVKMLTPADGINGIINFVKETVSLAGGKACPPLIVGVGIGGDLEKCALLSKEALLRPLDDNNSNLTISKLENKLLDEINSLNIGTMGLKGITTALKVKIETYPCHIASLPVGVSLMCHACRHETVTL